MSLRFPQEIERFSGMNSPRMSSFFEDCKEIKDSSSSGELQLQSLCKFFEKIQVQGFQKLHHVQLQQIFKQLQSVSQSRILLTDDFVGTLAKTYDNLVTEDYTRLEVLSSILQLLFLIEDLSEHPEGKALCGKHFISRLVALATAKVNSLKLKRAAVESLCALITRSPANQQALVANYPGCYKLFKAFLPKCGDFQLQASVSEILYRLTRKHPELLNLIDDNVAKRAMISIHESEKPNIISDIRNFVGLVNASIGASRSVYSFLAVKIAINGRVEPLHEQKWVHVGADHISFYTTSADLLPNTDQGADGDVQIIDLYVNEIREIKRCSSACLEIVICKGHDNFTSLRRIELQLFFTSKDLSFVYEYVTTKISLLNATASKDSQSPTASGLNLYSRCKTSIGICVPLPKLAALSIMQAPAAANEQNQRCEVAGFLDDSDLPLTKGGGTDHDKFASKAPFKDTASLEMPRKLPVLGLTEPENKAASQLGCKLRSVFKNQVGSIQETTVGALEQIETFEADLTFLKNNKLGGTEELAGTFKLPSPCELEKNASPIIASKEKTFSFVLTTSDTERVASRPRRKRCITKTREHSAVFPLSNVKPEKDGFLDDAELPSTEDCGKDQDICTSKALETPSRHNEDTASLKLTLKPVVSPTVTAKEKTFSFNLTTSDTERVELQKASTPRHTYSGPTRNREHPAFSSVKPQRAGFLDDAELPLTKDGGNNEDICTNEAHSKHKEETASLKMPPKRPGLEKNIESDKTNANQLGCKLISVFKNQINARKAALQETAVQQNENIEADLTLLKNRTPGEMEKHARTFKLPSPCELEINAKLLVSPKITPKEKRFSFNLSTSDTKTVELQKSSRPRRRRCITDRDPINNREHPTGFSFSSANPQRDDAELPLTKDGGKDQDIGTSKALETPSKHNEDTASMKMPKNQETAVGALQQNENSEADLIFLKNKTLGEMDKHAGPCELENKARLLVSPVRTPKKKRFLFSLTTTSDNERVELQASRPRRRRCITDNAPTSDPAGLLFSSVDLDDAEYSTPSKITKLGFSFTSVKRRGLTKVPNFLDDSEFPISNENTKDDDAEDTSMETVLLLFANLLKKFKQKLQSQIRDKNVHILNSTSEKITSEAKAAEMQIQKDVDDYVQQCKQKLGQIETQLQEETTNFQGICERFDYEFKKHVQLLDQMEVQTESAEVELKALSDKQKVAHRKLIAQTQKTSEEHLAEAERKLLAVKKAAKRMQGLQEVLQQLVTESDA